MDEDDPVDAAYLRNIERILKARLDPGPTMIRRLVAEVRRLTDDVRFHYDQAIAAQRRMEGLEAEVERLQATEREALRVLGAVVYYHCSGQVDLSEAVLRDDYAVERSPDRAAAAVRLKAWPTDRF